MSVSEAPVNFTGSNPVRIYLDHNATTPMAAEVRSAIGNALAVAGNPSSIHGEGREARDHIESARRNVAAMLGASPYDIVFTSGGTEADSLAIVGLARAAVRRGRPARILTTAIEHPAVLGPCEALRQDGFELTLVRVDPDGRLDLDDFEARCRAGAALAALSLANHEIGTVQDMRAAAEMAEKQGVLVHCDAVQAGGKSRIRAPELNLASLAISAHKFYGPKGIGALWIRGGVDFDPAVPAGHQERGRRPGTENVLGIVGMGAAAELAIERLDQDASNTAELAQRFEARVRDIGDVRIHGVGAIRIGNTVNVGFDGALGEAVVVALDIAGFAVSTGAACTSGSVEPSPVLLGMGVSRERAIEAVRFSFGRGNTRQDIDALLEVLPDIISRSRQFR
ncbi:MAG: cysteine desulfurase [Proteobacteria bacterium]|nr:cysteine desulfurase [Pseudomonadota bacterium]